MSSHRYWRLLALEAYAGGEIEISETQLLDGTTRADSGATFTGSIAPIAGTLSNLTDNANLAVVRLDKASVLHWDLGIAAEVNNILFGGGDTIGKFPLIAQLQWSDDDAAWTVHATYAGIAWPGARTNTGSTSGAINRNTVQGRVDGPSPVVVPTAATQVYDYGAVKMEGSVKGRADYLSGVLGQGIGRVAFTVKEDSTPTDIPVYRRVRLMRERDGMVIREMWSNPITGAYSFDYVDELQTYTVLSYDHNHNFRAVVADNLTLANGGVVLIP